MAVHSKQNKKKKTKKMNSCLGRGGVLRLPAEGAQAGARGGASTSSEMELGRSWLRA